ncbi:MAG TPA: NAD(P)/FAD-dependent oxidoreductase, partial [Thermoplasmata archaeon]|nr:NAD(P)/FAD-dependent oxidoreductase [Thermoplasmata archaeon]
MSEAFDVVVVGGGHNGLVTAAYLARAGRRVVVLEKRAAVGGPVTTEEIAPGFRGPTGASVCGPLRPQILEDLNLAGRGVRFLPVDPRVVSIGDSKVLRMWRDVGRTKSELSAISAKDADAYPRFVGFLRLFGQTVEPLLAMTPPNVVSPSLGEEWTLLRRALRLRRLGKHTMQQMLRLPPMSVRDALNEWFETDLLKASLAVDALFGTFEGPWSPGTAFGLIREFASEGNGTAGSFVRGGMGNLASALAAAARDAGATIRTETEVRRIRSDEGRVTGVELASGETIDARVVASNADPKRTFLRLVPSDELSPEFLNRVRNFEMNGVVAKVNFALDGKPSIAALAEGLPARFRVCPSLEYIERAFDDAKYGKTSNEPILDVSVPTVLDPDLAPPGKHVVSVLVQYAPYVLRQTKWDTEAPKLADRVEGILEDHLPGFETLIAARQVLTPADLE